MSPLRRIPRLAPVTCALLVAALALAACGDDEGAGGSASTQTAPPVTTFDNALWPDPAVATKRETPREVARSFIEDFLDMTEPALGEFQQGDTQSGEVQVYLRGEDGRVRTDRVIANVALRRLDGERWFVIAAFSDDIELARPRAGESEVMPTISSPVRIAGEAVGYEGNVDVLLHEAFEPAPIAKTQTTAGAMQKEPYSIDLAFERPRSGTGAIVVHTSGAFPSTQPFAVIPVRYTAG